MNNDVIIRQQIALRKEQLRVVEEGIYLLPNYIYAIRECGLEPSEEIQDDFYYVTRGFYLLLDSVFKAKHYLNLALTKKSREVALNHVQYGRRYDSILEKKLSKTDLISEFDRSISSVSEALQDILNGFDDSPKLKDTISGDRKEPEIGFWLTGYFYAVMQAVLLLKKYQDSRNLLIFDINASDSLMSIYRKIDKEEKGE